MAELKTEWELLNELNNMEVNQQLKDAINKFIEIHNETPKLNVGSFIDVVYRANLHYIIDNISNQTKLMDELQTYIIINKKGDQP